MKKDYSLRVDLFIDYMKKLEESDGFLNYEEKEKFRRSPHHSVDFENLMTLANALAELPKDLEWEIKEIIIRKLVD